MPDLFKLRRPYQLQMANFLHKMLHKSNHRTRLEDQLTEECAEVISTIQRKRRGRDCSLDEEIVDVLICIDAIVEDLTPQEFHMFSLMYRNKANKYLFQMKEQNKIGIKHAKAKRKRVRNGRCSKSNRRHNVKQN